MTLDEAKRVARVVETAEGGCGACINEAIEELNKTFPIFTWQLVTIPPRLNPVWPETKWHASIGVVLRTQEKPLPHRSYAC